MLNEPLSSTDAKRLIRDILESGRVRWTRHVEEKMQRGDLTIVDCENVLRAGTMEPAEFEMGT